MRAYKPGNRTIGALSVAAWGICGCLVMLAADSSPPGTVGLRASTGEVRFADLPARKSSSLTTNVPALPEGPSPATPREFFNAGTKQLKDGKFREAEAFFESALASQKAELQPVALYNLGHVRFGLGIEQLKKGPAAKPTAARARNAGQEVNEAVKAADDALAGNDIAKMVEAYMRGRGARKEAKAATRAVQQALQAHGGTLNKWQRAEGDFKGTVELKNGDADARQNADIVDRCIAKLVDSMKDMQQAMAMAGDKSEELQDKLNQLKGRIPAPDMPPGGAGEDEEDDEDNPLGPKPGQQEGPQKEGKEMALSPEQAGWLLDGFRLDSDRRLPMGPDGKAEPKDPKKPTW